MLPKIEVLTDIFGCFMALFLRIRFIMIYIPQKHHRRSIRLKGYDYSKAGAYFVTICTYEGQMLFGNAKDGIMMLNTFGKIVDFTWHDLPNHNCHIEFDEFLIMPNN